MKTSEPGYQIYSHEETPKVSKNGVHVKILCGESMGAKSPWKNKVPVYYLDFKLEPGASHIQEVILFFFKLGLLFDLFFNHF